MTPPRNAAIVWENPPRVTRKSNVETETFLTVAALKERPGQWARVFTGGGHGTDTRRKYLRAAGCETQTTSADSGTRHLYARWPEAS